MFGWFAQTSPLICRLSTVVPAQRHWLRISPRRLLHQLPTLGCVLYVPTRQVALTSEPCVAGVLLAQRELEPLLQTHWLAAASAITEEGPREWLECLDRHGQLRARLHLLPDTDYLAWDALLLAGEPAVPPAVPRWRRGFRAAGARVVSFRQRELGGLRVLDAIEPRLVSPLGREMAQRIAQAEAAVLHGA